TRKSVASGATFISYEKVRKGRRTPLLEPMSRIAGILSAYFAAAYRHFIPPDKQEPEVQRFVYEQLLKSFPRTPSAKRANLVGTKTVVLGGGVAGFANAQMAKAMGGAVVVSEVEAKKSERIRKAGLGLVDGRNDAALDAELLDADVIIGAVYVQ